ncbi:hypothetical protein SK128_020707, partial [Halocaridina rubra]
MITKSRRYNYTTEGSIEGNKSQTTLKNGTIENNELSAATKEKKAGVVYCPTTFDDVYCWPRTPANVLVTIPCPAYNNATRYCTAEGTWYRKSADSNQSWTNYSQCNIKMVREEVNNTLLTVSYTMK